MPRGSEATTTTPQRGGGSRGTVHLQREEAIWTPLRRLRGKQPLSASACKTSAAASGSGRAAAAGGRQQRAPTQKQVVASRPVKAKPCARGPPAVEQEDEESCTWLGCPLQEDRTWLREVGHTLRPAELGEEVTVLGDGWGGDQGKSYPAVVTEADRFTFTVVALEGGATTPWTQGHVLRQYCVRTVSTSASSACENWGSAATGGEAVAAEGPTGG